MTTRCNLTGCASIDRYIDIVEGGEVRCCEWQFKLVTYLRRVFAEECLYIDLDRLAEYLRFVELFPFKGLYPWEEFLLALFLCTFREDGLPRWNKLVCFIGRGAGKTGFISFLSFCCMSPVNGVLNYDVDVLANTEKQAYRSFNGVRRVLLRHPEWKHRRFDWNKTEIVNITTGSEMHALAASSEGIDGLASGLVVCDEVHYMRDYSLITTLKTGQGKCAYPRRLYASSNGRVRDGVYDQEEERCGRILDGKANDNGYLAFICKLDRADEVHDERNWEKACPSLPYDEHLMAQVRDDYADWMESPAGNPDFMTKRMGIPEGNVELEVTAWENLLAASRPVPDLRGWPCVLGLDFARTSDMIGAVLLFRDGAAWYALHHSWFCTASRDKGRIKAPLERWAADGMLTIVEDTEIHPSVIAEWIYRMQGLYDIRRVAIDDYRYTIVKRELAIVGYDAADKTVYKVRPSDQARVQQLIESVFASKAIAWGDDAMMRWYTHNTMVVPWSNGNFKYEKIEPKSRKTDGFMALVAAFSVADSIPEPSSGYIAAPIYF